MGIDPNGGRPVGPAREVEVGYALPPLTKHVTTARINKFEASGIIEDRPNIHTDPEAARRAGLGASPIGSGRMTTAYLSQLMGAFFGDAWNHTSKIGINFIRPVRDGDTITVRATVKEKVAEADGMRVVFDVYAENQNGDKTAVGWASAVVP